MQEQRLTRRLLKFWNMVRKDNAIPEMIRFNPAALDDIWPHCFKVSVDTHGKNPVFTYEYMGDPIAKTYGRDLTGMIVDQYTKQFPGKVLHYKFSEILERKEPMSDDGHFISDHGYLIKYRASILPFGNEKKGVTHIVVGLTCRQF